MAMNITFISFICFAISITLLKVQSAPLDDIRERSIEHEMAQNQRESLVHLLTLGYSLGARDDSNTLSKLITYVDNLKDDVWNTDSEGCRNIETALYSDLLSQPNDDLTDLESRELDAYENERPRAGKRFSSMNIIDNDSFRPRAGRRDFRPRAGRRDIRPRAGRREFRPRAGKRYLAESESFDAYRPRAGKRELRPRAGKRDEDNEKMRDTANRQSQREVVKRNSIYKELNTVSNERPRAGKRETDKGKHDMSTFLEINSDKREERPRAGKKELRPRAGKRDRYS